MEEIKHIKMSSIKRFEDIVYDIKKSVQYIGQDENDKAIFDTNIKLPKINFLGTTKLHGTQSSVSYNGTDVWPQSKSRVLTIEHDNSGFAQFTYNRQEIFKTMLDGIFDISKHNYVTIYGEFAGKGIQKCDAITKFKKTFYMFGIKYTNKDNVSTWEQHPEQILKTFQDKNIYSIFNFGDGSTNEVELDFDNLEVSYDKILEDLDKVIKECPVSKALGESGVGEGRVYVGFFNGDRYVFKAKDPKHGAGNKIKQPKEANPYEQQKLDLANTLTPTWRIDQAIVETNSELHRSNIGAVIKWVIGDIIKEEQSVFRENDFTIKDLNKFISKITKDYFIAEIENNMLCQ